MTKMKRISALLLCGALLLSGCSQTSITGRKQNNAQQTSSVTDGDTQNGDSGGQNESGNADGNEVKTNEEDTQNNNTESAPTPTMASLSSERGYSDAQRNVSILGLQEYKKLKTDAYTDKPAKDNVFLVLFLEIYNKGINKEYFNVNYLTASVDGKEIENTFLVNDPEGYPTIFANIEAGKTAKGFIVWEVPKNWKKMNVDYQGWRDSDGISLTCTLTKKDLKKPEKYEP